jgi:transcriptional regulator with XRE-family HTH domain
MEQSGWAKREAVGIGERVALYRRKAGLSAQDLANRCAALGLESMSRVVITKLENRGREAVSTAELRVLARALEVPAVLLLFPIGRAETVEVLPGQEVAPWAAYQWFIGDSADPAGPSDEPPMGTESPIILWWEHQQHASLICVIQRQLDEIPAAARAARPGKPRLGVSERRQLDTTISGLRRIRTIMTETGLTPPELAPEVIRIMERAAFNG